MIDKELEQAAQEHQDKFYFSEPSPASSFISGAEWMKEKLTQNKVNNFTIEEAKTYGLIESIVANKWFINGSDHLYTATAKGFVKIGGSKQNLPKDNNGNILLKLNNK